MSSIPAIAMDANLNAVDGVSRPASSAGLPFRIRPDLIVKSQPTDHGVVWIVHDPIALTYFHF